jgi:hypothetical protein
MTSLKTIFATALITCLVGGLAHAQSDTTTLFKHKAWTVDHTYHSNTGRQVCSAFTYNKNNQHEDLVELYMRDDDMARLMIITSRRLWDKAFYDDLILKVDDFTWTFHNADFHVNRNNLRRVLFTFAPEAEVSTFLSQIYNGRVIDLMDSRGTRTLVSWSLAGSAAALMKLNECVQRIGASNSLQSSSGYGASPNATNSGYGSN